jgi:mRNA-degrading endonuclease toxin of MazEF toxin-antitoxin module
MIFERGDIFISSIGGINGKPRPWIIVQANILNNNLFTTLAAPLTSIVELMQEDFRPVIKPTKINMLEMPSQIMLDRISVINVKDITKKIGTLSTKELHTLNQSLALVLGIL